MIAEYAGGTLPVAIASGPDGNLWFTDRFTSSLGIVVPATHGISEVPLSAGTNPTWIATGSDNAVWFTEWGSLTAGADKIGRIDPASHNVTEYAIPTGGASPQGLALGEDGNMWFTETNASKIGCITPAGVITEYATPTAGSGPFLIAQGPGEMWYTENSANKVGHIAVGTAGSCPVAPANSEISSGISGSGPVGITKGADGNMWFLEHDTSNDLIVAHIASGTVTEYPTSHAVPSDRMYLTSGADGNLWIADNGGAISRFSPTGLGFVTFTNGINPGASLAGITAGPDGNVWFADNNARIGKIIPYTP